MKHLTRTRDAFRANVKALRLAKGWTQQSLADAAGTSRVTVAEYESGKTMASIEQMAKIAAALDCEVCELLDPHFSFLTA